MKKIIKNYSKNMLYNLDFNVFECYIAKSNFRSMTTTYIKEQVRAIERATENASKSKETALKFLKDAGIITSPKSPAKAKAKK